MHLLFVQQTLFHLRKALHLLCEDIFFIIILDAQLGLKTLMISLLLFTNHMTLDL